jgi:aryl-alcohol dehydrogenase-like predicted oxidoreductase
MQYRELGRTGWKVSTISFGAWAIGGTWGDVRDEESLAALQRALDLGVNFFDTADVYGDGRSEQLLAKLRKERNETYYVATKAGRRLDPHIASRYNRENLTAFVERSLKNLEMEALDLLQLHCPPTEVYYMPEVFDALDGLVKAGKLRFYGVSVEKVEEALKAIECAIRTNYFQHVPPASAGFVLWRGAAPQGGNPCACPAFFRYVDRKDEPRKFLS